MYQAAIDRMRDEANSARSEAQAGNQNAAKAKTVAAQSVPPLNIAKPKTHKERELKSIILEVNKGAVQRAEVIQKKAPDLAEKVASGEIAATAALREIKKREVVEALEDIGSKKAKELEGVYDVIASSPSPLAPS